MKEIYLFSSNKTRILFDPSIQNLDIRVLAMLVGHELYHARQGRFSDSIAEEVQAYRLQYSIGAKLEVDVDKEGFAAYGREFFNLGPNPIDADLEAAREKLKNSGGTTGGMYGTLPLRQASNPFGEWITLINMARGLKQ